MNRRRALFTFLEGVAIIIGASLVFHPAFGEELDAGSLYSFCTSSDVAVQNACKFYILGVVVGASTIDGATVRSDGQMVQKKNVLLCVPDDLSSQQMVVVYKLSVAALATKYPADMKLPAAGIVIAAMHHSYPCKN